MEVSYERNLNRAVMILPGRKEGEENYCQRMILENKIRGFVPVSLLETEKGQEYCYRISGLVSLEEYLEHYFLQESFLKQLIFDLCRCREEMEEYLLPEDCLLVDLRTIFTEEKEEPAFLFCLYPAGGRDVREDIRSLLKHLMGKTDPADEKCANLCYRLYGLVQKENFYLGEFMAALEDKEEETGVLPEPEKKKWTKQLFAGRRNGGIMKNVRH